MTVDRAPLAAQVDAGRAFTGTRRVRWGDADRHGRLRLDALARYLQDVANDDSRDAGFDPMAAWVVRRTVIDVVVPPRLGEVIDLTTFAGGLGSRWAERRTTIRGADGGHVETASLWIFMDPVSGRPARLTEEFHRLYGVAADGRKAQSRLLHAARPDDVERRAWPLRSVDHDRLGHVNNAATWAPVEDELDRRGLVPVRAEIEYRDAIEPDDPVEVAAADVDGELHVWITVDDVLRASAQVVVAPR